MQLMIQFVFPSKTGVYDNELKDLFARFTSAQRRDQVQLLAAHYDRGYAFMDLGSKVASSCAFNIAYEHGIYLRGNRLAVTVAPSQFLLGPSNVSLPHPMSSSDARNVTAPAVSLTAPSSVMSPSHTVSRTATVLTAAPSTDNDAAAVKLRYISCIKCSDMQEHLRLCEKKSSNL